LLIVQVWLLSATLQAFLAGYKSPVVAAVIFSGLLFVTCAALNFFVDGVDRSSRQR